MTTALIVIDVQKIYTEKGRALYCGNAGQTVRRINRLIDAFVKNKLPAFFVRHVHKSDGSDLGRMFDYSGEPEEDFNFKEGAEDVAYDSQLLLPGGRSEFVKNRYSAFVGTALDERLTEVGVTRVVICGFMTNFCCESTARDAHDRDYFVDFVIDASGTPGTDEMNQDEVRTAVADFISAGFGRAMSTTAFLQEFAADR